jgi:hypothetical protein
VQNSERAVDGSKIAYLLGLVLEVTVFYRHVLFERGFIFPWDFRAVHLPLATFVAGALGRGQLPLWDPYTYCGNPIYANIQTALFYPPVLAATLASNWFGIGMLPHLLAWVVAVQVCFAGWCTFVLLRRLGAAPAAAFLAATAYQLGCFFTSQAEHMGAMQGGAWLPLVWLCCWELRDGLRLRWLATLSLALAMTVLAGLPQVAVAAFGSAFALAVVLALSRLARRTLPLHILAAWVWALLLSAVQVIPTAQLTRNSVAKFRAEWLKTGGGIKLGALYSLVMPNYWNVFDLSKFHGPPGADLTFLYLYCSMAGLALALCAALWKPDRLARGFALFTLAAGVWMLGDSTPIGRTIFQALPVEIRIGIHPEYTLPVFSLGIAVLAGLGAHRFLRPRLQLAAAVVIAIDLIAVGSGRPFNTASLQVEPGITHDSIDGSAALAARLRLLTASTTPAARFDMADAPYAWSSSAPILEIPTANGCDPLAPERTIQWRLSFAPGPRWGTCYQVVNAGSPAIGLGNVRYLVSRSPVDAAQFHAVDHIAGYTIYENSRSMPRYFFAARVQAAASLQDAAVTLHAADLDPQTAIVEGDAAELPSGALAGGEADVVSYEPSRVRLRTHSTGASFLVAADSWYPGWQAAIDGVPAPIYPTDVAFRGLALPPGQHTVEMRFVPYILYWSAAISALALMAALLAYLRSPPG